MSCLVRGGARRPDVGERGCVRGSSSAAPHLATAPASERPAIRRVCAALARLGEKRAEHVPGLVSVVLCSSDGVTGPLGAIRTSAGWALLFNYVTESRVARTDLDGDHDTILTASSVSVASAVHRVL